MSRLPPGLPPVGNEVGPLMPPQPHSFYLAARRGENMGVLGHVVGHNRGGLILQGWQGVGQRQRG